MNSPRFSLSNSAPHPCRQRPRQALERLRKGNSRFVKNALTQDRDVPARRLELKDGQWPWTIVLSCADSRVVPEVIFDTGIGELYLVRVAGNIANTSSLASIEYAVLALGVLESS